MTYFHPSKNGIKAEDVFQCRVIGTCTIGATMLFALETAIDELNSCKANKDIIVKLENFITMMKTGQLTKV